MKTIRISEEVYDRLEAHKLEDESYSALLARLTDRRPGFEKGFGAMSEVDFEAGLEELDTRME